ncbi:MAG: phosphoribosyl-AMP cyclohydrolase [Lachnospiraceae bacterium]|nr:phosphoribosyl-AMP cyclohydrolase [Lachnospiraceae bacterium]
MEDLRVIQLEDGSFRPVVEKALKASFTWEDMKLNSDGLVPVIVQDAQNNDVLMMAYMNEEAFNATLDTGVMTYYSRSRNELWIKGLTSGHFQYVQSIAIDCDNDTLLAKVDQVGAACHTGNRSCFYRDLAVLED